MEDQIIQILLELANKNADHIAILNSEMGGVQAELGIIKWFLGLMVVGLFGLFWKQVQTHREVKNGNGKN